jgi:NAD(P)-dependent dehydrogenase (short-subunit alcohol dehydrogenase family)
MNILLTGASRGIGAAALEALSSSGHRVAGHSTRGGDGLIGADLADPAAARVLWNEALERLDGRIDGLINNAGIFEGVSVEAGDDEWHAAWARTLQVNLQAAADFCRLAINHFRERGDGGRIVNVASRAAYRGDSPEHWHYAASKAGMIGMTKTIARGFAADGIFAFAVAPGFTVSEMTEEYLAGRGGEKILADIPLGRVTSTKEVAEAIRWLATEAPAASTGSVIDLNGASYVR